ncbi:MAG: ROK family protein [Deltaproteobacteria bacterium]|nr:ROK family protein [Deltaproteobacteria bacterium]
MKDILALDVGGTHIRSAWVTDSGMRDDERVHADLRGLTTAAGAGAQEALLAALVQHIELRLEEGNAHAVALGMPGFIDRHGVIAASPNLPGISDFPLKRLLGERLTLPVTVANDALCAARGAWLLEDPRPPSLAMLTLGTGVGGGLVLDGRPVIGDGGTAMEIGHIPMVPKGHPCGCGKRGCLEQYASATALTRIDAEAGGPGRDARELAEAANSGEARAREIYQDAGRYLGLGVATLVQLVDVRTVRIGGGLTRSWNLLEPGLRSSLDENLIPPLRGKIDVAPVAPERIDQIALLGAADLACLDLI